MKFINKNDILLYATLKLSYQIKNLKFNKYFN